MLIEGFSGELFYILYEYRHLNDLKLCDFIPVYHVNMTKENVEVVCVVDLQYSSIRYQCQIRIIFRWTQNSSAERKLRGRLHSFSMYFIVCPIYGL